MKIFRSLIHLLLRFLEFVSELKVKYQLKDIEFRTDPLVKLEKQIVYNILGVSLEDEGDEGDVLEFVEFLQPIACRTGILL